MIIYYLSDADGVFTDLIDSSGSSFDCFGGASLTCLSFVSFLPVNVLEFFGTAGFIDNFEM